MRRVRRFAREHLTREQRWALLRVRRRVAAPLMRYRARDAADLNALARRHGTDKSSEGHDYARLYQHHFADRRETVRTLLEIGVGGKTSFTNFESREGGASLRTWADYFPDATVVGVDIHDKAITGDRIRFERGDQADAAFLAGLVDRYAPFDIVIDDGSHRGPDITASYRAFWPAVTPGGLYVIEDLGVAYHPDYAGGPPGTPGTAVALLKDLLDDTIIRQEHEPGQASYRPSVAAVHVYGDIAFLEKAR
jgi:hypothetical protein